MNLKSHITIITVCGEVIITILFIQASESEWLEISEEEDDDDDDETDDDENEEGDASQTDEDEEEVCTNIGCWLPSSLKCCLRHLPSKCPLMTFS
jgi:hypothetical protein